jgi:Ser-tRNA(Ala) deacylase AlaX
MENLILEGKVVQLLVPQTGESSRGAWKKQDFVIETSENYPKKISIVGFQDMADKVAELKEGDEVKVAINIESREYNSRWYTDVKAWKIDKVSGESAPAASAPPAATDDVTGVSFTSEDSDDLPF